MLDTQVIIAGGGIGGLSLALTLNQIGVPCQVLEAAPEMRPLGVGINLQPNAVRELFELGIDATLLDRVGVAAKEWALVGLNGKEIYAEPRGLNAGYRWPQYAAHRGDFHMLLYREAIAQLGESAVTLGARVSAYREIENGVAARVSHSDGTSTELTGSLLIGADGIHSAVRAQMHPDQPPIHWGGKLMWRGTTRAKPIRTSSSFIGLGTHQQRMVIYPISATDDDGTALINWIAEVTMDNSHGWQEDGWFREVPIDSFIHHFEDFRYDWLDVPTLVSGADCAYQNPMIDRDPIHTWTNGRVALMGDAAHAMYPTGSNGASQAIVDARVIGAKMIQHGVSAKALAAYDEQLCEPISQVVLRNRGDGPFGLLTLVNERCGGEFDQIDAVISQDERDEFMARYKQAAGFAMETLNSAAPTISPDTRITQV